MALHAVRFPAGISLGASGGPERRTEIVVLGSGAEERNSRWADSKRSYNAGYGIKGIDDLHAVIAFFEERRGRLHGFRWKDWSDYKSCAPAATLSALDQEILASATAPPRPFSLPRSMAPPSRHGRAASPSRSRARC
jgi:uncharacterized protein (TIGR02217 family)